MPIIFPPSTLCPACEYELGGLIEGNDRVRCPECGRRWTRAQVAHLNDGKFYWGRYPLMMALAIPAVFLIWLTVLLLSSSLGFRPSWLGSTGWLEVLLISPYLLVCNFLLLLRNTRRRLDEFAWIAAGCLSIIVTFVCAAVIGLLIVIVVSALK